MPQECEVALSASGLRALRYAREVEGVGSVVALDNDKVVVEACKRNIKLNGSVVSSKVETQLVDARVYMLTHETEFDVVDLDPHGSPSIFLDSAVQSVADGGMLMCTSTDMALLCGNNGEVFYSKYGEKYCHEMALRVLLACIESHANRYKCYKCRHASFIDKSSKIGTTEVLTSLTMANIIQIRICSHRFISDKSL